VEQFQRDNHLGLRIVADSGGRLARTYNAAWLPRAYLLSATGALLWCQPDWRLDLREALSSAIGGVSWQVGSRPGDGRASH
jgi:hypothetical protein